MMLNINNDINVANIDYGALITLIATMWTFVITVYLFTI